MPYPTAVQANSLHGKRALVCGATQGIGLAIAHSLAACGAAITVAARNADALQEVVTGLSRGTDVTHGMIVADWNDPEALAASVRADVEANGPVQVLVNNTGGPPGGPILDAAPDEFMKAMTMHVVANQLLAQAVVPGMRAARWGRIINVISTSVRQPIPGLGVSNTTRGAVASWAKTLANEVAPHGITVNNVLPGFTNTERLTSLIRAKASAQNTTEAAVAQTMLASVPAGRFGDAHEIAAVAKFLASPEAGYVTGVSIPVDGGRTSSI